MILAPKARDDLTEIYLYIARDNPDAAARFVADLSSKIEWVAATGFTGVPRDWIRPGLRALPYRERCIYFRVNDETVTILRVLHGRQDVQRQEFS